MSVTLQDRLERLDPKHASIWKRVFAAPAICLFDVTYSRVEEEKCGQTVYYRRLRKVVEPHCGTSLCNMSIHDDTLAARGIARRLITAVYLPVESSLRRANLVIRGRVVATWTPDQPGRGISLETILLQSRRIPHGQRYYGGRPYDYRPSPEIRIRGQIYRRVVLLYPGINHWNAYFSFTLDKCKSFEFFQEELVPSFPTPDVLTCFSPFPAAEMRSEIPKRLLASPEWAVPALLTEPLSPSLTTSWLPGGLSAFHIVPHGC